MLSVLLEFTEINHAFQDEDYRASNGQHRELRMDIDDMSYEVNLFFS
jgi:hypothetical protein